MTRTKAESLEYVRSRLQHFHVPDFLIVDVAEWQVSSGQVVSRLQSHFGDCLLAVRSSAQGEDGHAWSKAGEFESVLNVPASDLAAITDAIGKVVRSYSKKGLGADSNQFMVQRMMQGTVMSGVVFTHDLNTGAPYYVINYDEESGRTDTVTSGSGEYSNRTLYIHRGATSKLRSERFQRLLGAVEELESVLSTQFLDIEFGLMPDLTPVLFQVRRITTQPNWNRAVARRIDSALTGIQSFVRSRLQRMEGAFGSTTVLAQMPDWNPAEMIGRAPRALAMSLYEALITNHAWRTARATMGYAVPAGQPLMVSLFGQPFIDTRLSFHSYLPAALEPATAEKLVDAWVARLAANPGFHDKVEFDVAVTCYSFDIDDRLAARAGDVLRPDEQQSLVDAFRHQLGALIDSNHPGSIDQATRKVQALATSQDSAVTTVASPSIPTLFRMLDECVNLGTVPFAMLARHGFIAKTLLLSLAQRGILSDDDVRRLQSSVRTVASDIVDDMRLLQSGKMPRADFMRRYGHLRPGTYDIRSLRYDQMSEFGTQASSPIPVDAKAEFVLTAQQRREIDQLLAQANFTDWTADGLIEYVRAATAGREFGKFVFTRSVSDMLELIAGFGEKHGLSREELSHVPLASLLHVAMASGEGSIEDRLRAVSELEAEKHALSSAIRLPQALSDEAGVHVVPFQVSHPNFITDKRAVGACLHIDSSEPFDRLDTTLDGKIVLIERADPGFDWIFSYRIAGLVTKYGGANSHMAIRCAEFGIPAAIGCGEQRFSVLMDAGRILLDCQASLIEVLH